LEGPEHLLGPLNLPFEVAGVKRADD